MISRLKAFKQVSLQILPRFIKFSKTFSTISVRVELKDITGHLVSVASPHTKLISDIDESIMSIITREDDAAEQLRSIITRDPDCTLAHALYIFEICNSIIDKDAIFDLKLCFDALSRLLLSDSVSFRERSFAKAAILITTGDYRKAAQILESILLQIPSDALALKLAQDCYIAAGDSINALKCVARNLFYFEESHILHGHILGLLSCG